MDDGFSWGEEVYIEIPHRAAALIAQAYGKEQVIIICRDKKHYRTHVTTYGKSFTDSANAAEVGNQFKKAMGWPDRLCHEQPARVQAVKQALKRFKALIGEQECHCNKIGNCMIHDDLILANEAIEALL